MKHLVPYILLPVVGALLLSGCSTLPGDHEWQTSPKVQFSNSQGRPIPARVRRVAMLPVYTTQTFAQAQKELDATFRAELSKMLRFEVAEISRPELQDILEKEQISSVEVVPAELIAVLQKKYGADAVIFTDLTHYRPYRPVSLGIRSKLIDLNTQSVLWSADSVIDSANPEMANAARIYANSPLIRYGGGDGDVVLQSPRRFAGFAAHQLYSTLPGRSTSVGVPLGR